jgi:phage gpG-like protein
MPAFTAHVIVNRGTLDQAIRLDEVVARAMPDVSREMRSAAIDSFRDARDPWGHPWPPLRPTTIENRKRRGNTRISPLVDTGALFDSADNSATRDSATVEYGDGLPDERAAFQFGTSRAPARAFLPLETQDSANPSPDYLSRVLRPLMRALQKVFD